MQIEEFALVAKEGLVLKVYVQPGASRSELTGLRLEELGGKQIERLRVKLRARAVEGAANQALIEFLAACLACPKSSISLTSGQTNRAKSLFIEGDGAHLREKLIQALGPQNQ
jgi:uncharacterized protein (TIGR00251 family)